MGLLSAIGMGSFWVVSVVVGIRLLRLASRTRELPELAMGLAFFSGGGLGYLLIIGSSLARSRAPEWMPSLWAAGLIAITVGAVALAFFNWRVFVPEPRGVALFAAACSAMLVGLAGVALGPGFSGPGVDGAFGWLGALGRMATFGWAAAESWRYFAMMRRREALGLVDSATTRRFLYWALGAGAATLIFLNSQIRQAVGLGMDPRVPGTAIPTAALGLTAAACVWLAFRGRRGPAAAAQAGAPSSGA